MKRIETATENECKKSASNNNKSNHDHLNSAEVAKPKKKKSPGKSAEVQKLQPQDEDLNKSEEKVSSIDNKVFQFAGLINQRIAQLESNPSEPSLQKINLSKKKKSSVRWSPLVEKKKGPTEYPKVNKNNSPTHVRSIVPSVSNEETSSPIRRLIAVSDKSTQTESSVRRIIIVSDKSTQTNPDLELASITKSAEGENTMPLNLD